jgi:hypothetical protein
MRTTRRRFINTSVSGAVGLTLSRALCMTAARAKTIPIGFQLYSVRGEFERNVPETLKTLGKMGFKSVEFWGYGGTPNVHQGYSGADLRKMLDDSGLKCRGMHLDLKALDNLQRTIDTNRTSAFPLPSPPGRGKKFR